MSTTLISTCTTTACSFNENQDCTAATVRVGGEGAAACTTFSTIDLRPGLTRGDAQVATCQRLDCSHNDDLVCGLSSIEITGDTALCASYEAR